VPVNRFRAFIGLGSNVGNRELMLRRARAELAALPLSRFVRMSAVYETSPVLRRGQPRFLNAAAEIETALRPPQLLARLKAAETRLGRRRRERWGPREIDLDILMYEGVTYSDGRLTVPHDALAHRAFALVPLRDIAPSVTHPTAGRQIADLAAACDRTGVIRRGIL
jgi:2-amino-4-hydroxy-6-hydroxymethyldihydropteridine diphosphokinase